MRAHRSSKNHPILATAMPDLDRHPTDRFRDGGKLGPQTRRLKSDSRLMSWHLITPGRIHLIGPCTFKLCTALLYIVLHLPETPYLVSLNHSSRLS